MQPVGFRAEIVEELEEHDGLEDAVPAVDFGEAAVGEEGHHAVQSDAEELNHLQSGQMPLPPEIFLVARAHGGHQIVEIHDAMHKRVERRRESTLAARHEAEAGEAGQHHDEVMENVEESDLIVLFAQDEEDGVEEIDELRHVEAVAHQDFLEAVLAGRVVHRLADETVAVEPRQPANAVEHPAVENNLKRVVDDQEAL